MATYTATLIRGSQYRHLSSRTTFKKGVAMPVSNDLKNYLETNAIDISNDKHGEKFVRPKFKFAVVGGGKRRGRGKKAADKGANPGAGSGEGTGDET